MTKNKTLKMPSKLGENLAKSMDANDLTILQLSELSGVAVGTIQKILTDPQCNPTLSSLNAISEALKLNLAYLLGEDLSSSIKKSIPLISWETLEAYSQGEDVKEVHFISTNAAVSSKAFAIRVRNKSMLPLFPEDTVLILDQEKNFYDGAYVLAWLHQHSMFVFKQLLIDEPNLYLRSINPSFQESILPIAEQDMIFAVLVQSLMNY